MGEKKKSRFHALNLNDIFQVAIDATSKEFSADETSIMTLNEQGQLKIVATNIPALSWETSTKEISGKTVAARVAETREPLLLSDNIKDSGDFEGIHGEQRVRSSVVFPIMSAEKFHGVLCLNRTLNESPFTEEDVKKVSAFVAQLADAMESAKL